MRCNKQEDEMARKDTHAVEQKPDEELSYAEQLRRREEEDRYLAEQRENEEQKTGCLGISASVLVGTFCILFLATGLGFFGYGIYCFINGEYDVTKRLIMVIVGAVVTIATVFVWRMFHRNLHNDE
jgi:hypothetical protein